SAGYRLKKLARKHKKSLTVSAAFAMLLVLGVVASTWQAVRATRAEQKTGETLKQVKDEQGKTQEALAQVKTALAAETTAKNHARGVLDETSSQVIDDWLVRQKELTPEQRQFLERQLVHYERFTRETGDTPEQRSTLAAAFDRVGTIRSRLGLRAQAEAA